MDHRVGWWRLAGPWLAGWLVVSLLLVGVATIIMSTRAWLGFAEPGARPIAAHVHDMSALLSLFLALQVSIGAAAALAAAFPLQVTALWVRQKRTDAEILAGVAALSTGSAIISFIVFYVLTLPLTLLASPDPMVLPAVLIGFYILHVAILALARRLSRAPGGETAA